jgi:cation:H+ antiporter
LLLLLAASQVVIDTANFFADAFGMSLALIGILITGLGNCFPEAYFSIISAKKKQGWMILGDLMGSVIMCSTLVLGVVALISPFEIVDFSPFFIVRMFTIVVAVFSIFIIRTGQEITKREGVLLILMYILFLITEIFFK